MQGCPKAIDREAQSTCFFQKIYSRDPASCRPQCSSMTFHSVELRKGFTRARLLSPHEIGVDNGIEILRLSYRRHVGLNNSLCLEGSFIICIVFFAAQLIQLSLQSRDEKLPGTLRSNKISLLIENACGGGNGSNSTGASSYLVRRPLASSPSSARTACDISSQSYSNNISTRKP